MRAAKSWAGTENEAYANARDRDFYFEIRTAAQATNASARVELCYSRSCGKRRTLQLGPNYATLIWHHPALSLQATSIRAYFQPDSHVAARKILESLKNWSGHGLNNWTGSAGSVKANPNPETRSNLGPECNPGLCLVC